MEKGKGQGRSSLGAKAAGSVWYERSSDFRKEEFDKPSQKERSFCTFYKKGSTSRALSRITKTVLKRVPMSLKSTIVMPIKMENERAKVMRKWLATVKLKGIIPWRLQNNKKVKVTEMRGKKLLFNISGKITYLFVYQVWHEIINKLYQGLEEVLYEDFEIK
jgi:hypothetical protein